MPLSHVTPHLVPCILSHVTPHLAPCTFVTCDTSPCTLYLGTCDTGCSFVTPYSSHNAPLHITFYTTPHHTTSHHCIRTLHHTPSPPHYTLDTIVYSVCTKCTMFIHRTVVPHTLHRAQFIYTPTNMVTLLEASPSNCVHHMNICSSSHTAHCLHLDLLPCSM